MAVLSRRSGSPAARDAVLATAEALLAADERFADLTVERLVAEAGIARSTFYVHFRDRRDVLMRLVEQRIEPLRGRLRELELAKPAPDRDRLGQAILEGVKLARSHAPVYRAVVEASAYDEELARYWRDLSDRAIGVLADRLAREQRGRHRLEPRAAALALASMFAESCFRQVASETGVSDEELAATLAEIWWRAAYAPRS